jgi:hypothetical protein
VIGLESSSPSTFRSGRIGSASALKDVWIATVVANVGTWVYNAASGWLMTSLDADPLKHHLWHNLRGFSRH